MSHKLSLWGAPFAALLALMATADVAAAANRVQISELGNLRLGEWRGRGGLTAEDWHCVRVRGGPRPRTFRLEAYGDGPGGAFQLSDGRASLPYAVAYDDGSGLERFQRPGASLAGLEGSETGRELRRCRRGDRDQQRRVRIEVAEPDLVRAPAGRFQGTLLLMVVPE